MATPKPVASAQPQRQEELKAAVAASLRRDPGRKPVFTKEKQERALAALPKEVRDRLEAFILHMRTIQYLQPDGKPKPEWKVFYGDTWDTALDAARAELSELEKKGVKLGAAGGAAWRATADVAHAKRNGAQDQARIDAWTAAEDAALRVETAAALFAVEDAAECAVWDAGIMARAIVVSDLDFPDKEKHLAHAKARMEVWEKGYALVGDVDGVLYVCCSKARRDPNTFPKELIKLREEQSARWRLESKQKLDGALSALPKSTLEELEAFIRHIWEIPYLRPDGKPNPEWRLFGRSTWKAARDAAYHADECEEDRRDAGKLLAALQAALTAAGEETANAAWYVASNEAERAVLAAWHATVYKSKGLECVKLDAAGDAGLMAVLIVAKNLDFPDKEKHLEYARKCMEVWEKGYGRWNAAKGELYVYCERKGTES